MVEIINKTIYSSKGSLGKPSGAVIHNDAGGKGATAKSYVSSLPNHNPAVGFA